MVPTECVLHIEDATCAIGGRTIFQGLSDSVREGERLHLGGAAGRSRHGLDGINGEGGSGR